MLVEVSRISVLTPNREENEGPAGQSARWNTSRDTYCLHALSDLHDLLSEYTRQTRILRVVPSTGLNHFKTKKKKAASI